MSDSETFQINHNEDENRFEVALGNDLAKLEYMRAGNNIIYTHTEVPPIFEGRGVGKQLAHHAMEYAREQGFKVQALCPFVNNYVREHPEYHAITWGY